VRCVRRPDDVIDILRTRFQRDYPTWARGQGRRWPWRLTLNPPSTTERTDDPAGCHEWSASWAGYTGPGEIEHANLRFPTGPHRMPTHLRLARPGDVAAADSEDQTTWRRCGLRLTRLQAMFPDAVFERAIRQITELDVADYQRLELAAAWLRDHPTSGLLLRQLPIEGVHTKWLSRHAVLLLALLGEHNKRGRHDTNATDDRQHLDDRPTETGIGDIATSDDDVRVSRRRLLHTRLGLRIPPDLVQISVCDPRLRAQVCGMRHFAASVEDLNRWPIQPDVVVILENKETGYAVTDDLPGTVILHGHGRYVEQYARITWVHTAQRVVYWGDLDTYGLHFISNLRAHGVPAVSILTDCATLQRYQRLAVSTPAPPITSAPPDQLTVAESQLYQLLIDHIRTTGEGLLLEQERIPWTAAVSTLRSAVSRGGGAEGDS
jgi:hypothetical protein